ncbi:MAG: hypothetical protein ACLVJH_12050 [Faecalibacterium prausnitzii]
MIWLFLRKTQRENGLSLSFNIKRRLHKALCSRRERWDRWGALQADIVAVVIIKDGERLSVVTYQCRSCWCPPIWAPLTHGVRVQFTVERMGIAAPRSLNIISCTQSDSLFQETFSVENGLSLSFNIAAAAQCFVQPSLFI